MLQHNEFTGKTVFVAGGTSGINLGIAKAFAAAGAKVAVFSRSQERVDAAVATLRELTSDAMGFSGDVRDMASVQDALSKTHEAWGTIDVLCSGAAGNFVAPAAVMSPNGFKSVMDIDLLGSFLSHPQRVIARERLIELSRTRMGDSSDRSIDVLVSRLRRKLSTQDKGSPITTVRGVGYMFNAEVSRA